MTQWIKKGTDVKNVQTEDLSYYYSIGYEKCEAPAAEPVLEKKGQKKTEDKE